MFDALRRAEAERRRRSDRTQPAAIKPTVVGDTFPETPAHRFEPVEVPRFVPSANVNGVDPFPGGFLRELGILRNGIEAQLGDRRKRVIVFTSAMHEEGVTTMAASYARLLALHGGEKVLLLELNARHPSLAARMNLGGHGVTHFFSQQAMVTELAQPAPSGGFDVIHVGEANPTKIQVNLERALPWILEEALKSHDTVIIDAPPVVICPETPPIARHADGVVMVVRTARTKREVVQRSINLIRQFEGRVLGVVLNLKRYYIPEFLYRRL